MSDSDPEEKEIQTWEGRVEAPYIQQVIGSQNNPGVIHLPEGEWEENIIVSQHNLTIVGHGEDTVLIGEGDQPTITILAPSVRLINLAVRAKDASAIAFTKGNGSQVTLQNVHVLEAGQHGVYREQNYGSALNAIVDCTFSHIDGHAIYAETGAGPRNVVQGNIGEDVNGDFIRWGVNDSMLIGNSCEDGVIHLTQNSAGNFVTRDDETNLQDEGQGNQII